jgi:quercetin dioxygenase-like cupin family protein
MSAEQRDDNLGIDSDLRNRDPAAYERALKQRLAQLTRGLLSENPPPPADEHPFDVSPMMPRLPALAQAAAGRTVAVVGDVYRYLATGEQTDGKYALCDALVPPGGGPPPHIHSREEEGFYILEGEITFTVNGERTVAGPGTFANIPIGVPHSFRNESDRPARMLISVAPAGLERMFFEVGQELPPGATSAPPSKDEIEKLIAAAPRYGITLLPPPGH